MQLLKGALKLTYAKNPKIKNISHLRLVYNFFGDDFSKKEVLSTNPFSFIDPDGGKAGHTGDGMGIEIDPLGGMGWSEANRRGREFWGNGGGPGGGTSATFESYAASRNSNHVGYSSENNYRNFVSKKHDPRYFETNKDLVYEAGQLGRYKDVIVTEGKWVSINGQRSYFTTGAHMKKFVPEGQTLEESISAFSKSLAVVASSWSVIDASTNHKTYTTTRGVERNIADVVSKNATNAAKTSKIVRGVGISLAGIGVLVDVVGLYNHFTSQDPNSYKVSPMKFATNTGVTSLGLIGGAYLGIGAGAYFLIEGTIGWDNALNSAESVRIQNQAVLGKGWQLMGGGLK